VTRMVLNATSVLRMARIWHCHGNERFAGLNRSDAKDGGSGESADL
jgi:hypothetical protein